MSNGPLGNGYTYGNAAHKHAVTAVGSNSFAYDANGNMTSRTVGGQSFTLTYDAENRLVSVSGSATASFLYDGDGARVKGTVGGVTTYYPNQHYEVAGGTVKKYYYAGANRVAMKDGGATRVLLGDHLGSTAVTVAGGSELGEVRYRAFGATRFTSGTTPTTYRYTGQREESSFGLYYYGARWYDPALGHFVQPDAIVPNAGHALDYHRYGYVRFNPLKYNDPTGHMCNMAHDAGFGSVGHVVDCLVGGGGISRGATGAAGAAVGLGAAVALNTGLATGSPPMQAESPAPLLESVPGQVLQEGAISTSIPLGGSDTLPSPIIQPLTSVNNPGLNVVSAKPGPKPWAEGPHNETIGRRIGEIQQELGPDWEHIGGGNLPEETVRVPEGGYRNARRPDITFRNKVSGEHYRENVGRTYANGQPVRREKEALDDLERAMGHRPVYTPYD